MRHLRKGRKFHRTKGDRASFLRVLAGNLIMQKKIKTTEARAKELKTRVEKLITLAKKQNLASLRVLISRLGEKAGFELFNKIAPKMKNRSGGCLRIIKTPEIRKRDASKMAIIEFVEK
jgi:large subunit ribosomal protein L17